MSEHQSPVEKRTGFSHQQTPKVGVLIVNLGTPDAPTPKALRVYLKEFLWDPRIVEIPRLIWWFILNVIILQVRPKKSAKAYKSIWTERGSPLAYHTADQSKGIEESLEKKYGDQVVVEWAMRYGNPSMASVLEKLRSKGVQKLVVLPLYPQYSAASTASTFDALAADFSNQRWLPELRFINCYHDDEKYINALVKSIENFWSEHGRADKLLFSYHGIPLKYLHTGDPYHCQCLKTSRLVAQKLNLQSEEYMTTFQSRFGANEWLKPYTDATMKSLPSEGVKSVQIVCPGFAADCLETIEEIAEENCEYFKAAGGEKFHYIPALNSTEDHIEALSTIIQKNLEGWNLVDSLSPKRTALNEREAELNNNRQERFQRCPHNQMS
ncbi:MAG: ferrochelatase [Cellvibrionaceae bacterium]